MSSDLSTPTELRDDRRGHAQTPGRAVDAAMTQTTTMFEAPTSPDVKTSQAPPTTPRPASHDRVHPPTSVPQRPGRRPRTHGTHRQPNERTGTERDQPGGSPGGQPEEQNRTERPNAPSEGPGRSVSLPVGCEAPCIGDYDTVEADVAFRLPEQDGKRNGFESLQSPTRSEGEGLLDHVRGSGTRAPYFGVPAEVYDELVEWRPILAEVRGFMALAQYLLFGAMRNEHGVVTPYEVIFRAFGLTPSVAQNDGISSGALLDLYRRFVDHRLHVLSYNSSKGRARCVARTGFPESVLELVERFKARPESFDRFVYLIDGSSANRRHRRVEVNEARHAATKAARSVIPTPASAEVIRTYLNERLDEQLFANGRYGVVKQLPRARTLAHDLNCGLLKPFDTYGKTDQALRTLSWMGQYPRPLYEPSDFSPRLKADHYNQLMNLHSVLRPTLYTDRDVELDLDKAHMASLVVVARKLGISTPLLTETLEDATRDIWTEFADCFDAEVLVTGRARRKAAKRSYAAVYGACENNLYHEMLKEYRDRDGVVEGEGSHEPFRPVMQNPLMAEVYETAQWVLEHVLEAGGLEDAEGRYLTLDQFTHKDSDRDRAKSLLAYVCASYEQVLIAEAFKLATDELDAPTCYGRPAFKIWLYQADGFTIRVDGKADADEVIARIQRVVQTRADELGMPTRLSQA